MKKDRKTAEATGQLERLVMFFRRCLKKQPKVDRFQFSETKAEHVPALPATQEDWERLLLRVCLAGALNKERKGEALTESQDRLLKQWRAIET